MPPRIEPADDSRNLIGEAVRIAEGLWREKTRVVLNIWCRLGSRRGSSPRVIEPPPRRPCLSWTQSTVSRHPVCMAPERARRSRRYMTNIAKILRATALQRAPAPKP